MSIFTMVTMAIAVVLLFIVFKLKSNLVLQGAPYEKKRFFFTQKSRSFYHALKLAVGHRYVVFARVSVADLVRVKSDVPQGKSQAFLNKIKADHVDYVLCEARDLTIVAAITFGLNETERTNLKSLERDHFLTQVFEEAALPLLRFKAQSLYDVEEVKKRLQQHLTVDGAVPQVKEEGEAAVLLAVNNKSRNVAEIMLQAIDSQEVDESALPQQQDETCPKCAAPMVLKKAEKGRRAGKYFLTCSTFPVCKRAMPLEQSEQGMKAANKKVARAG